MKLIITDLDNTLLRATKAYQNTRKKFLRKLGQEDIWSPLLQLVVVLYSDLLKQ